MRQLIVKEPWERQKGEFLLAYQAFLAYRDMDKPRSIRSASLESGAKFTDAHEWAIKWEWQTRAKAWNLKQDTKL